MEEAVPRVRGQVLPPSLGADNFQARAWVLFEDAVWVSPGDLAFRNLLPAATERNASPGLAQIGYFAFRSQTKPANDPQKRSESSGCICLSARGPGRAPVVCSVPPKGAGLQGRWRRGMCLVCRQGARLKQPR